MKLILGYGLLGRELESQSEWHVMSRSHRSDFDFNNIECLEEVVSDDSVTEIINCIAYTQTQDNDNRELHWETNYKSVMNLADLCIKYDKKLVHISTDYVYAKSKPKASEYDIPVHYDNWYTYTKLLADNYIMARMKNYLIFRSSFKPRPFPFSTAWIDLIGNFDYVDTIAFYMTILISKGVTGVYNVGTYPKSLFELAKQTNPMIMPIHKDEGFIDSTDITMNLSKMESLLFTPEGKIIK